MKQNYNNKAKYRSAWIALVLLMITALPITAQNVGHRFQVGQLWYEVVDATKHTVKVTYENTNAAKPEARQQTFENDYANNGFDTYKGKRVTGGDKNADNTYKGYSGQLNGTITIPETVEDADGTKWTVAAIGTCAFINERGFYVEDKVNNKEKRIRLDFELPSTIEHIEEAAFYQAYACTINFPKGLKTIGRQAFYRSVVGYYYTYRLPNFRRSFSKKTTNTISIPGQTAIGPQAFEECSTRGATLSCPNIRYLGYQAFKKSGLTIKDPVSAKLGEQPTDPKIIAMYANLPGVDMESGAEAFTQYDKDVVTLKEGITTIPKGMFENAFRSKPIDKFVIPSTVTSIEEGAFANAGIKSFNELSTVTKIGARAFENGALSGDFVIRDNVEEIGDGAFKGNTNLTGFTLIGSSNCTVGAGILEGCPIEYLDLRNVNSMDVKNHLTNLSREANSGTGSVKTLATGLPVNVIVYLPNVPNISFADGQDVNFIKFDGTCTKLLFVDGKEYEFPHAIKANEVVYNRDFSDFASGKNCFTIFLPYAVKLPKGIRAYNLDLMKKVTKKSGPESWAYDITTEYYMFKSIPDGSTLEANRPYLLRITDGKSHTSQEFKAIDNPVVIAKSNTEKYEYDRIKPNVSIPGTNDQSYVFTGSTEKIVRSAASINWHLNPWTLGRDENGKDMWKRMPDKTSWGKLVPPFRGVIMAKSATAAAKQFVLLDEDNQTDGINDVTGNTDVQQGEQRIYTIDGRYVGTNFDSLPSGMYIMKGKKTLKTK
ncbi:leucine-rich repeat domain-containing protein [Prevotella disiens]|uniref:leucine-rich repeat domain-containing protein n=1 Tax=Prevotella disiens TaxID=28130 RepID=UPI00242A6B13|nr:leucine-rich repeat domain-containing protein [Prevotella disiens]